MTIDTDAELRKMFPPIDQRACVAEFIKAFDGIKDHEFCRVLIREEVKEMAEAVSALLKEMADVAYVCAYAEECGLAEIDADTAHNLQHMASYFKLVPEPIMDEVFRRVHLSNMSKIGEDGKPVRREDGKVLKGPKYQPPELMDLV